MCVQLHNLHLFTEKDSTTINNEDRILSKKKS